MYTAKEKKRICCQLDIQITEVLILRNYTVDDIALLQLKFLLNLVKIRQK